MECYKEVDIYGIDEDVQVDTYEFERGRKSEEIVSRHFPGYKTGEEEILGHFFKNICGKPTKAFVMTYPNGVIQVDFHKTDRKTGENSICGQFRLKTKDGMLKIRCRDLNDLRTWKTVGKVRPS